MINIPFALSCMYQFVKPFIIRWLDPSKLVRKQVRRSNSHSSANTSTNFPATQGQNGHGQKSANNSNNLGGGGNVVILYFRVKFYVTGKTTKTNKPVNNTMFMYVMS